MSRTSPFDLYRLPSGRLMGSSGARFLCGRCAMAPVPGAIRRPPSGSARAACNWSSRPTRRRQMSNSELTKHRPPACQTLSAAALCGRRAVLCSVCGITMFGIGHQSLSMRECHSLLPGSGTLERAGAALPKCPIRRHFGSCAFSQHARVPLAPPKKWHSRAGARRVERYARRTPLPPRHYALDGCSPREHFAGGRKLRSVRCPTAPQVQREAVRSPREPQTGCRVEKPRASG